MLPIWMLIAQGAKKIADNQNEQTNALNNQFNTQNNQSVNNNSNAFSTISSIYNNYLNDDKKKNMFGQIFGNR